MVVAWLVLTLVSAAAAETSPPQLKLKAYALSGSPEASDISPNEQLVLMEITRFATDPDPSKIKATELAQLWDFRQNRLVAETSLAEAVLSKTRVGEYRFLRRFAVFSSDGQLAVVYFQHVIYVLGGNDLRELGKILLREPAEMTRWYRAKSGMQSYVEKPRVSIFELSPVGHKAAIVWTRGYTFAQVELYDLDWGLPLAEWNTQGWGMGLPKALAWMPGGQQLVLAIPNTMPCFSPGNSPDIFEVDAQSGKIQRELTSGLLVGDIGVTPDGRVWAVDYGCIGVFTNHHPKLRVFDIHLGKRLKELSGRGSGVRYVLSVSASGQRVVAYTGRMNVQFDWGDMVAWGSPVDRTFSVWNSKSYEPLLTSQNVNLPREQQFLTASHLILRLSASGRFVLFGNSVYELPDSYASRQ